MKTIEQIVIDSLAPTFQERMGSENDWYWESYERTLFDLKSGTYGEGFVRELNHGMSGACSRGVCDACVDVASTLESLAPEKYKGKFKY